MAMCEWSSTIYDGIPNEAWMELFIAKVLLMMNNNDQSFS